MRQQVNLHHAFVKESVPLPAKTIGVIVLVFAVVLLLTGSFTRWQASQVATQVKQQQESLASMNDEIKQLGTRLEHIQPSQALTQRIERSERQIRYREQQMQTLEGGSRGQRSGYAETLTALARQHQNGLWLTSLSLSSGSKTLRIEGLSQSADMLPAWLGALQQEAVFAGRQFRHFDMQREEDTGHLAFLIRSACPADDEDCPTAANNTESQR